LPIALKDKLFVSCSPHHVFLGWFFTFKPQCYLGHFWYWYFTAVFASIFLCSIYLKPLQMLIFMFCYIMPFVDYNLNSYCHKLEIPVEQTWICLNLILYPSSTNSITFCNRSVFGYVSLGGCQSKSSQTDRHRIKSYTFLYFKHQSYTK
jgi:hypothetical protein